jgi:hypothetical protein
MKLISERVGRGQRPTPDVFRPFAEWLAERGGNATKT